MTKPTQIAAAKAELRRIFQDAYTEDTLTIAAKAALAAAAEASPPNCPDCGKQFECFHCGYRHGLTAAAEVDTKRKYVGYPDDIDGDLAEIEAIVESRAKVAAAEVGEPRVPQMIAQQAARLERQAIDREIAATIERCAQVAEAFHCAQCGADAAAAIRALKEQP